MWRKLNTQMEIKNLCPTVKHGGGNVFVWRCMRTKWTDALRNIQNKKHALVEEWNKIESSTTAKVVSCKSE